MQGLVYSLRVHTGFCQNIPIIYNGMPKKELWDMAVLVVALWDAHTNLYSNMASLRMSQGPASRLAELWVGLTLNLTCTPLSLVHLWLIP